jgi:hypothetical protein
MHESAEEVLVCACCSGLGRCLTEEKAPSREYFLKRNQLYKLFYELYPNAAGFTIVE